MNVLVIGCRRQFRSPASVRFELGEISDHIEQLADIPDATTFRRSFRQVIDAREQLSNAVTINNAERRQVGRFPTGDDGLCFGCQ